MYQRELQIDREVGKKTTNYFNAGEHIGWQTKTNKLENHIDISKQKEKKLYWYEQFAAFQMSSVWTLKKYMQFRC